ncbi:MarR family winged helix-turn-helix transcriptional regulator [Aurantimonas sp. VKM B-3413]|uniref:MarR family winged helix-turn-helix transcriptional regulator n=1 Tax=Aurantimonas sp. VKM B-3413 TaxID=2779401 RepID=UPI001E503689|nr:MarR family winged helix-turn-helix transcriptional regulator [Aurantimonas sp. VKM B-3413]MCB8838310.1 MarR family winged helix-turn-helix transcriptional regulator [Aurantimonas sp. VKM B-3413]
MTTALPDPDSTSDRDDPAEVGGQEAGLAALRERPGFLIRRLHQIHVALFAEECAGENITPVQFSILTALEEMGGCEQTTLALTVGLDRTNIADVLDRLQKRGLVRRRVAPKDRRRKLVALTDVGVATLSRIKAAAAAAHDRTVKALPPEDRQRFLDYLVRLVEANNEVGRAPLRLT